MSALLSIGIPFDSYEVEEPVEMAGRGLGDAAQEAKSRIERMIVRGNFAHRLIETLDAKYHSAIFGGREPSPEIEGSIADYYRAWLVPSGRVLAAIDAMESEGFRVVGADEFRANVRGVRGVFMDDDAEFFDLDSLAVLADKAIEEHRGGRTVAFDGPGN